MVIVMSRLHKIYNISFVKKCYILFTLMILYGYYKNGIIPIYNGVATIFQTLKVISFPIISIAIGKSFDKLFNYKEIFSNTFYSLLFSMIIPISTNLIIYAILLALMLYLHIFLEKHKIDLNINVIVILKLLLVLVLCLLNNYFYANSLESSGVFQYTFIDMLFGNNISGLFISNIILLLVGFIIFSFDHYYKREIPLISYGIYLGTLIIYTIFKGDLAFFLQHMFLADVLFSLIFIATLSSFSPYTIKGKTIYGFIIGILILPFSILFNFNEGGYIAILIADVICVFLEKKLKKF